MIVLALVARGSEVMAETHDAEHERFLSAAQTILGRIPPHSSKLSYAFEDWLFHYISQDGIVYLAVADTDTGRRMPFVFLHEVMNKFVSAYDIPSFTDPSAPVPFPASISQFSQTLLSLKNYFNTNPNADPIRAAKEELEATKDIMTQNVEQILSRGERIELLMDRTDVAAHQSIAFRRRAVGLRRQMWWKNVKVMGMAGFCLIVSHPPPSSHPFRHFAAQNTLTLLPSSNLIWNRPRQPPHHP
ncbi:snare-like protein [Violaceomyces palustris]|uniref:Snare-like protein n=1 Tax=Violaceomyces palustris TaxID=1673888 RepID=A0ACD0P856_9BASI|nr:snare-like protein [Violaceomyces palustris]